ncbi:hypothetical protein JDV02_010734 [Purpureocillium takamizusanense]|uniref:Chromo domain-containing protein n=1 Tax=Purpureocillium takamizusanense TaxID=2060973 RepID=A0A9Q8VGW0_9HYPO|nr:uncharacterized protein JDV02_010734 [Purpureocillium takamizusanense]UNI25026.1 hypothetical protein JDV02_010734 [Purpureocillium takamizusanense]
MAPAVFNTILNTLFSPQKPEESSAHPRTPSDGGGGDDARPPLSPKAKTTSKKNQNRSPASTSNTSTPQVAKSTGKVQKREPAGKPASTHESFDGPSTPTRAPLKRAAAPSSPAMSDAPAVTTPESRPKSSGKASHAADKPAVTARKGQQKRQQTQTQSPQPQSQQKRRERVARPAEDAMEVDDERRAETDIDDKHEDEIENNNEAADDEGDEFSFKRFGDWRWAANGTSIEIEVEWAAGDTTWEPEANLHEDAPDALLGYWREEGGRPVSPTDPDVYDILRVRDHSADRKQLLVEWVGFGPEDATWVSRRSVERTAPSVVTAYMRALNEDKAPPRKRAKKAAKATMASSSSTSSAGRAKGPARTSKATAATRAAGSATGDESEGASVAPPAPATATATKKRGRRAAMVPAKRRPGVAYRK